jgi:hypothetical protein
VRRAFGPDTSELDRIHVGDITYIWTWEGWLYLATISTWLPGPSSAGPWPHRCERSSWATPNARRSTRADQDRD